MRGEHIVAAGPASEVETPKDVRIIDLPNGESKDVKLPKTLAVQDVPRPPRK